MRWHHALAVFAGAIVLAAAGVSVAAGLTSSHQNDFYAAGTHQFYVWCADGRDHVAYEKGASAEDAQLKLYHAHVGDKCWPVWQSRVSG